MRVGALVTLAWVAGATCVWAVPAAPSASIGPSGPQAASGSVEQARRLAYDGQRDAAVEMLQALLAADPGDGEARTLLGTVYSWQGRYDDARRELSRVLETSPVHGDALPALINVELWSDHPDQAERLARRGLAERPEQPVLLYALARSLDAQGRRDEARDVVARLLEIDARNEDARSLAERLAAAGRRWTLRITRDQDWFDDRDPWSESTVSLKRATPHGSVIARVSHARRFGLGDELLEIEAYPRLWDGAYAFVSIGHSPDATLYPDYRWAADVYQSLPGSFEASLGYRRLEFGSPVDIYTAHLGRYRGNWLFMVRAYLVPDTVGDSVSVHVHARRYSGDGESYLGVRYGHGRSREELRSVEDFEVLSSDTLAIEWHHLVGARLELTLGAGFGEEERAGRSGLRRASLGGGLGWRF